MTGIKQFISVEEALEDILRVLPRLGTERRALTEANGFVLSEEIIAPADAPPFDNSAMDGFAFAYPSPPAPLVVVGESAAGTPFPNAVEPGEAVRIMTGAAVPEGCDTVAMREICEVEEDTLTVDFGQVGPGDNVRLQGTYMAAGSPVMSSGHRLAPSDIGLLASFGRPSVVVARRPLVCVVTTGTELVEPGAALGDGQIYNSNAYMLRALIESSGAEASVLPIVPDDHAATMEALNAASSAADLVITVGGVSVGDYDFVRDVLEELASPMEFWKVRMKPGKPLAFGMIGDGTAVLGLPGNPMSAFVAFHVFAAPALARMQGAELVQSVSKLPVERSIRSTPKRREYVLGHLDAGRFVPHSNRSSGNVVAMHGCTALAIVEEGVDRVEAGQILDVVTL